MARFEGFKNDGDFIDRTGHPMSLQEQRLRLQYPELNDDEKFLMRENGWSVQDILLMRRLKEKIDNGDGYGPDKNFPEGRY